MLAANVCTAEFLAAAQASRALSRARGADAGEARARCAISSRAARCRCRAATSRPPPTTRSCCCGSRTGPTTRCCRRCCCARCSRRATGRTTSATSASPTRPMRTSRRRSAAIRTCSCIARSRRCSRGSEYKPGGTSWEELGVHCSLTERRADDATRDVENWLKCYFMQDKVGETFGGTISGVTSFGIFVTLDDLNIDGLVHVTELGRDYFHFDAGAPRDGRRAQRPRVPARRPRAREGRARRPRTDQDRLHAGGRRRRRRIAGRARPTASRSRAATARPRPSRGARNAPATLAPRHGSRHSGARPGRGRAGAHRRRSPERTHRARCAATAPQAYRLHARSHARRRRRILRRGPHRLRVRLARPGRATASAGRDGHGFDADHDRVHRRDRRHAGHQAAGRGDHRGGDARRDRFRAKASRGASRCSPDCR